MRVAIGIADDPVARIAGIGDESVVLVIVPGRDPLSLAMARAAIDPLAVARAPATRVNAVCHSAEADPAAIDAAIAFLEGARSTTGQILDLT